MGATAPSMACSLPSGRWRLCTPGGPPLPGHLRGEHRLQGGLHLGGSARLEPGGHASRPHPGDLGMGARRHRLCGPRGGCRLAWPLISFFPARCGEGAPDGEQMRPSGPRIWGVCGPPADTGDSHPPHQKVPLHILLCAVHVLRHVSDQIVSDQGGVVSDLGRDRKSGARVVSEEVCDGERPFGKSTSPSGFIGEVQYREGPFVRSTHLQAASGRKYTVGRILYPQGLKRYHVGSIRPGRTICRILPPSTGFMREVCLEEGTACNICSSPSGFINCGSTQRRTISRIHTLPSGFVWEVYGRDALRLILGSHLRPEASVC